MSASLYKMYCHRAHLGHVLRPSTVRVIQGLRTIVSSADLPQNEPLTDFTDPAVREKLDAAIADVNAKCEDIPIVIGGKEYRTKDVKYQLAPHNHKQAVAKLYYADKALVELAVENALISREKWEATSFDARSRIFMRAASLLATKYRYKSLAACMIGQGKTAIQADIDCVAELVDFLRFNVQYAKQILASPPLLQAPNVINAVEWRGLEGFVAAITPFNFSAIGGNLSSAPAIMGNVVLWKPTISSLLSNYLFFSILREAGLPDGVMQFIPGSGSTFGDVITRHPWLAGIVFTGSSNTFNTIWKNVGSNVGVMKTYPKLIGECGGKNYHFVHPTADIDSVVSGTIRSGFEYGGQKCSACARLYIPDTLWPEIREKFIVEMAKIKLGDPHDYSSFLSAVIDDLAFVKIKSYIEHARNSPDYKILSGGHCDNSKGYFISPTLVQTTDPKGKLMTEEIFGPIVTVFVYPAGKAVETLDVVASTSPYALTGAVFSQDREFIEIARKKLRNASGNFYINDKSTGAVVGQQPFGGARASGTNDKAGMGTFMLRWVSPLTVKEALAPLPHWSYPYMSKLAKK